MIFCQPSCSLLNRREQILYNCLRIGHMYQTQSYLLKDADPPVYLPSNTRVTVEHNYIDQLHRL